MSQPYVGEIRMFGGNFAPQGWALCDGSILFINGNDTLFTLIGTTYGGDGVETFALPDLRGRIPIARGTGSTGTSYLPGEAAGTERVLLGAAETPSHTHPLQAATGAATQSSPAGEVLAESANVELFIEDVTSTSLSAQTIGDAGGGQQHDNLQPFLCVAFIIALLGINPTP
jgi:microcystin-dependent protein